MPRTERQLQRLSKMGEIVHEQQRLAFISAKLHEHVLIFRVQNF